MAATRRRWRRAGWTCTSWAWTRGGALLPALDRLLSLKRAAAPGAVAVFTGDGGESSSGAAGVETLAAAWLMMECGFCEAAAAAWLRLVCPAVLGAAVGPL